MKSEKEKQQWQGQTHLLELTYKGVIEEPEGQRNFRGFDYRAYLKTQEYITKLELKRSNLRFPSKRGMFSIGYLNGGAKPLFGARSTFHSQ